MIYDYDLDFDRRWAERKMRGRAHEHDSRRRFAVGATVDGPRAAAAFAICALVVS